MEKNKRGSKKSGKKSKKDSKIKSKPQSKKEPKIKPRHPSNKKSKREHKTKIKRIETGIKNLNRLIEGGFEKNSTNTIVGGAGSGKSILATQFLYEGLKRGESGLYVTFEEKKNRFYRNMLKFGWDLEKYEKKGLFTFLEYTPIKVKTMLEEGGGSIETLVLSKKVIRIVIDSMTSFALLFEDELARREAGLALFNMIRKWVNLKRLFSSGR